VNFDNRSFQLHDEATLCVHDKKFAGLLHEQFERDTEASEEIEAQRWRERPRRQRVVEAVTTIARREL
jgi:cardiolipin synthase